MPGKERDRHSDDRAKAFEEGVPTVHVIRLPGADHYVYLTNEADVLGEMKSFPSDIR